MVAQPATRPSAMDLKCEHLQQPLGIDAAHPRLSWKIDDSRPGAGQTAYQIRVAKDSARLDGKEGVAWNSGKVLSGKQLVTYQGAPLEPFTRYYWKVVLWNNENKMLAASPVASFETGLMDQSNWRGRWISDSNDIHERAAPYFRRQFSLSKPVLSARAYITAAGLYEFFLNGKKVGNQRLDPMYTRFDRRNLYVSYDITPYLTEENAVGIVLGNGWYNHQPLAVWNFDQAPWRARPAFCMDVRIVYTDGTIEYISTDSTWKTSTGPLVSNNIYTGEHYDARKEIPGWNTTRFDDRRWQQVVLRIAPSATIVSQAMHPIRNVTRVPAISLRQFSDTVYVFDLGRNIAGVSSVRLQGDSGTIVRLKHGERLYGNGRVDLSNIDVYYRPRDHSDPFQTDIIYLEDTAPITFMPAFNYKGFRYVELTSNRPLQVLKDDLVGYFMHSDVPRAGAIESSNPLLNQLWQATNASYLSNLFGYPTDCPQREKNGWTGDGHFAVETGLYNFDAITIYEKWMADHRDEQRPDGVLPDIIPTGGWGYGTANGTDWTGSIALIPWNLYLFYGDIKPLQDNYNNIKAYVNYVDSISPGRLTTFGRGDWVPVKSQTPLRYSSSVYYYVVTNILAKSARLLGHRKDAVYYGQLAEQIRKAINDQYFDATAGIYGTGLQTELSLALHWGIVPEAYKATVARKLAERVRKDGMHLDVGVLGAKAILNALSDNGQAEVAYQLALQDTYPSWGWWIKNGATTLYENWNIEAERDISLNHMMFGEIGGWFFKALGGIKPDEKAPGFKNILVQPHFPAGLERFSASYNSSFGTITSSWKRVGTSVYYTLKIPPGATASLAFDRSKIKVVRLHKRAVPPAILLKSGTFEFMLSEVGNTGVSRQL